MFPSTTAFLNFIDHHFDPHNDCRTLRRIECAVRGEELYLSFSSAPPFVQELMKAVFDFYKWNHISIDGTIPVPVMMDYIKVTTTVFEMRNEICFGGLIAFGRFVDAYLTAVSRMNSRTYFALPERSMDDATGGVCDIFERCQTDPLPDFLVGELIDKTKLPSRVVNLPEVLPLYMRPPQQTHEPLEVLRRAAVSVLSQQ